MVKIILLLIIGAREAEKVVYVLWDTLNIILIFVEIFSVSKVKGSVIFHRFGKILILFKPIIIR